MVGHTPTHLEGSDPNADEQEMKAVDPTGSVPDSWPLPRRVEVPDHDLLRCIGRGSYGDVWLARGVVGVLRAVKVVRRDRFSHALPYEREFLGILRIEALSRAEVGLVDILHVGRHEPEGYFYYVMELADDASADDACPPGSAPATDRYAPRTLARELKRRGTLPVDECVTLGLNLSRALGEVHRHGLVHRDVKPSNILYVGGVPKLGDVGLAGDPSETHSRVGTEGYIPPEGPGTPQADVFGLGKTLYVAATGQDASAFPLLPAAAFEDAAQGQLAELNEVILKACASDPLQRYPSAEEMQADLVLLQSGHSVRRQRTRMRWSRRLAWAAYPLVFGLGFVLGAMAWAPRLSQLSQSSLPPVSARQQAVDLSRFYNASLRENWMHDFAGNDLSALPTNWHRFGPAFFKAGGVLQLTGGALQTQQPDLPDSVAGIPIGRRCSRVYFLQGTGWLAEPAQQIGGYIVHYADGRQEEIPLRYGEDVENWWWNICAPNPPSRLPALAWVGTNAATGERNRIRLYVRSWSNPRPEVPIATLDFVSTRSVSYPFLVALTVE